MKLHIKRGLPGRGKTTEAYKEVHATGNAGRVNRDDLRAMLFESQWSGFREKVVIDCEKAIAQVLLKYNLRPIIDDTNLTDHHLNIWRKFGLDNGVDEVTVDALVGGKDEIDKAVAGDSGRQRYVGKAVIHGMALNAGLIEFDPSKQIVLVDIDGTIADGSHREHYVSMHGQRKDWKSYFHACGRDAPIDIVVRWVRELIKEFTICLVSGRPDSTQRETLPWLETHEVPYDYIFMRRSNDNRPDYEVKQDILNKLPKDKIAFVLDDRPSVIRMWKANRLRVFPVRGAIDEF